MAEVLIDSANFQTYASLADADEYLVGDFGAALWRAEDDDNEKGRALITATRILNRQSWDLSLDWIDDDGVPIIDHEDFPQRVIDASIMLAKLIHAGSGVDDDSSPDETGIKRQKAGSVEIEYFVPTSDPTRLPTAVHELIAPYLGGTGIAGSIASGVDSCSDFTRPYSPQGPL